MPNNNKNEFDNKKPSQTQKIGIPIEKSLNAATILVNIMLEQNNVSVNADNSSNMDTNNNNQHNQKNK